MRLEIDGWSAGLKFSACHLIPGHEKCGRLHGHTYAVHVRLVGRKNEMGYIADFHEVKELVRRLIDRLDHRVLIPARHPSITVIRRRGSVELLVGKNRYTFPPGDVLLLDLPAVTAEQLSEYLLDRAAPAIARLGNVSELQLGLCEGVGQGAWAARKF
ncbi:MAG: 6-pyruvoyl tetrahydropterin synthase family protein [Euryarchaeota archaeon]|nr:6-pyruvoyl tetrahydropterin synthase family protein [Euryarchaeota archaeon]